MINEVGTLYKRGRNTILEWVIKIESINRQVNIFMSYGEINGAKVIRYQNNIKGKNIGKANETNPYEQALSIAESKINNKQREGYKLYKELFETNPDYFIAHSLEESLDKVLPQYNTDISGNEIPMKCQQYYRSKKPFTDKTGKVWDDRKYYFLLNPSADKKSTDIITEFPCYIQPKVNGVRAFIKLVNGKAKIFSKKGLDYNLPHISSWLEQHPELFLIEGNDVILDGELFIHGEVLGNITSAVTAPQLNTMRVTFELFDIAIEDMEQKERFKYLYANRSIIESDLNSPIKLVPTLMINSDSRVQELTDLYISQGYEGSIMRQPDGLYEFGKRPKTITKLKRTISEEFTITGVVPQEVDPSLGMFVCTTPNGQEFTAPAKGNEAYKKLVMINASSFIGKQLTCVFYEYTEKGKPFHIIDNIVRDYE